MRNLPGKMRMLNQRRRAEADRWVPAAAGAWLRLAGLLVGVPVVLLLAGCEAESVTETAAVAPVERMDLNILVEKGGSLQAANNREIRSEVMGQNRVIYLIEEGKQVEEGDVLVRVDSAELEERLTQQEITYQSALASKIQAEEQYEIQVSQNQSDVLKARLDLEFAVMDLEKYTGLEGVLLQSLMPAVKPFVPAGEELAGGNGSGDGEEGAEETGTPIPATQHLGPAGGADSSLETAIAPPPVDPDAKKAAAALEDLLAKPLEQYTSGEAAQLWRAADSNLKLSKAELARAQGEYEGSEALYNKKFIARTELEADEISFERAKINVQEAEESLRLLRQFTHPRNLKTTVSAVRETVLELERVERKARAELSRAAADRESKRSTYSHQKKLLDRFKDQVEKCTITAPGPGMVVYERGGRRFNSEMLEEGSTVYERQLLIKLPDLSKLVVDVQIHETRIALVQPGQKAEVSIDAVRGARLEGTVTIDGQVEF